MVSKKRICIAFIAGGLFFCLTFPAIADQDKAKHIWKIATLAPKGVGWGKHVDNIILPAVEKATNGEVCPNVYYGGLLGDDKEVVRKMRKGMVDGAGFTGQGSAMLVREFSVLELPFLFNDYGEVDYIREKMIPQFEVCVNRSGCAMLYWIDQDFDQFYSASQPLSRVEQFADTKFLTWYGILEENLLMNLGADPLPASVLDVSAMVREGTVDSLIAPAIWMVGTQLYTVIKYVNPLKIRYSPVLVPLISSTYDQISAKHQQALRATRDDVTRRFVAQTRTDNELCIQGMVKYGVTIVNMENKEIEKIRERVMPVWDDMAGKLYPRELLDELKAHLVDYREKNKS